MASIVIHLFDIMCTLLCLWQLLKTNKKLNNINLSKNRWIEQEHYQIGFGLIHKQH